MNLHYNLASFDPIIFRVFIFSPAQIWNWAFYMAYAYKDLIWKNRSRNPPCHNSNSRHVHINFRGCIYRLANCMHLISVDYLRVALYFCMFIICLWSKYVSIQILNPFPMLIEKKNWDIAVAILLNQTRIQSIRKSTAEE